jgi:AcrR family transcriptional regulator
VERTERTRILEAMAEAMAERSVTGGVVTMVDVAGRAGVSTTVCTAIFADRESCLLAAFEEGVERASARVVPAFGAEGRWLDAIKAGLAAFLRFLEEDPVFGGLLVFHSLGGGPEVLRRRMHVLGVLAAVVDRGREEVPLGKQRPPIVIAEGVVGAVLTIVQNRMLADPRALEEQERPIGLFGSLASMIVLPYLGATIARRELTRPAPRARMAPGGSRGDGASAELDTSVRLTYRTARVLRAIADYPGASNREVAERAGIVDQGQVSKLLSRLEARELIVKIGEGRTRGAPNSWGLSEQGELVLKATATNRSGM